MMEGGWNLDLPEKYDEVPVEEVDPKWKEKEEERKKKD